MWFVDFGMVSDIWWITNFDEHLRSHWLKVQLNFVIEKFFEQQNSKAIPKKIMCILIILKFSGS